MNGRHIEFVTVNLTVAARDALRRAALDLTSPAKRRVSMSDVVTEAVKVAMGHQEEMVESLQNIEADAPTPISKPKPKVRTLRAVRKVSGE